MAKQWSVQHSRCVECGQTDQPHAARGLCRRCYGRDRYRAQYPSCKPQQRLKDSEEMIPCACGCGQLRRRYDSEGREYRYINHHWGRGRKCSPETIARIKANRPPMDGPNNPMWGKAGTNLGKKFTEEHRRKISLSHTGELNPNWKGGRTPEHQLRLDTPQWVRIANRVRKRDEYTCQNCGYKGKEKKMVVHHIIPWRETQDDSLINLITLCTNCHQHTESSPEKRIEYSLVAQRGTQECPISC